MGSERNKREEGDGEKQGGAQDLSSHMELSGGTEPGRKMEAALPPSPPPPSTTPPSTTTTGAASPSPPLHVLQGFSYGHIQTLTMSRPWMYVSA